MSTLVLAIQLQLTLDFQSPSQVGADDEAGAERRLPGFGGSTNSRCPTALEGYLKHHRKPVQMKIKAIRRCDIMVPKGTAELLEV